jgi:hypothetical protein
VLPEESPARDEQIAEVARHFIQYLHDQTGTEIAVPESVEPDTVLDAFGKLDSVLDQLSGFASVYGTDPRNDLEPLVLPAAALCGEYLRFGAGARWVEPDFEPETTLAIVTADGVGIDLTGAVRASLLSGMPNLRIMAEHLLNPEEPDSE